LLADGRVLVAGGGGADGPPFESAELYDPSTGMWSPAHSMRFTRMFHTATLLSDSTVLVAGGLGTKPGGASSFLDNAELYIPKKDKWRSAAESTMSVSRTSHTATLLLDDTVLVAGGQLVNDSVANADLYLPEGFVGALSQK
jgi:hypothetical protein